MPPTVASTDGPSPDAGKAKFIAEPKMMGYGGNGAAGEKEIGAGLHRTPQRPTDAEHEDETDNEDGVVDGVRFDPGPARY